MAQIGYSLISSEERKKQYKEFMTRALYEYYERTCIKSMELFRNRRGQFEEGLVSTVEAVKDKLQESISSGRKGRLSYIHLSYLLSGALSGEMLIKLDFYDEGYYRDVEEIDCYWDCSSLFWDLETEYRNMAEEMKKNMIRIQSGEFSQLRVGLTVLNYMILKPVLKELVKSERVEKQLRVFCNEKAYILYGAYLDQAEVIHQLIGGK